MYLACPATTSFLAICRNKLSHICFVWRIKNDGDDDDGTVKVSNDRWRLTRTILLHVSGQMWGHKVVQTVVCLLSGPSPSGCKVCWDRKQLSAHLWLQGTRRYQGTSQSATHEISGVGTTRYLLPWDKRALLFVSNDRSRVTGHMFVLSFSQFLSHPVVYNLLNSRWYRSFASVRKEPWTNPSRWGYFFLNLWPVLDVFLFPVVFACFFIVHFIKRLWRKTRGR